MELPDSLIQLSLRLYQKLLHLFPARFREEYGPLTFQAFRDQLQEINTISKFLRLWLSTIGDIGSNALEEHMSSKHSRLSRWMAPQLSDLPLLWVLFFAGSTVAGLYLSRILLTNIVPSLRQFAQDSLGVAESNPLVSFTSTGNFSLPVFAVSLAIFQALVVRNSRISGWKWFFASSAGWTIGVYTANEVWQAAGSLIVTSLMPVSPHVTAVSDLVVRTLVIGVIIGIAQLWPLWAKSKRFYFWPLVTILAFALYYFAVENFVVVNPDRTGRFLFTPYLMYGVTLGVGLIAFLHKDSPSEAMRRASALTNSAY